MIAFARLAVFGFLALSVIYLGVSLYSRSVRRGKLRVWWEEEGRPGDRDEYVAKGMKDYENSLRHKLILGVYVVPIVVITMIIYFTNFY